jgi:hypothetical protein
MRRDKEEYMMKNRVKQVEENAEKKGMMILIGDERVGE